MVISRFFEVNIYVLLFLPLMLFWNFDCSLSFLPVAAHHDMIVYFTYSVSQQLLLLYYIFKVMPVIQLMISSPVLTLGCI